MRLLRRDTSAELTRVEQAIEAAEARQAELAKQYEAALESDDSIDEVRALKHQMDEKEVERTVLYGRREKREAELAVEREEQDRRDYQAEVDETVARLPRRAAAAKAIEKALRDLANATKEFVAASAAAGLPTFRLGTLVQETFAPDRGLDGPASPAGLSATCQRCSGARICGGGGGGACGARALSSPCACSAAGRG